MYLGKAVDVRLGILLDKIVHIASCKTEEKSLLCSTSKGAGEPMVQPVPFVLRRIAIEEIAEGGTYEKEKFVCDIDGECACDGDDGGL